MSKGVALKDLRRGDVVRVIRVVEVDNVGKAHVSGHDVKSGLAVFGYADDWATGAVTAEVIKKARPSIGAVITAGELRRTPWKRGTVIKTDRRVYTLGADGRWFTPAKDGGDDHKVTFDWLTLTDEAWLDSLDNPDVNFDDETDMKVRFTIIHLPE